MINNARGSHVSPGVYMKEVDVTYSTKSLGQTTLGLVGETLKGPAFQPIKIESWADFVEYFGETSPEKFPGNDEDKYLKYELPYVAKSYLKESKQLEVCRVLGLSGYNAGSAWAVTADTASGKNVVAILRSKGRHTAPNGTGICGSTEGDEMQFDVKKAEYEEYSKLSWVSSCENGISKEESVKEDSEKNFKLNVKVTLTDGTIKSYPVSMIPGDMDYIMNVFGSNPLSGSSSLFVEELYDLAFDQIKNEVTNMDIVSISKETAKQIYSGFSKESYLEDDLNKVFLDKAGKAQKIVKSEDSFIEEAITEKDPKSGDIIVIGDRIYKFTSAEDVKALAVLADDYNEGFRPAMTPWVVSEVRGQGTEMELKTLFRFHTISDGAASNDQVKISIENIDLDYGTFDIIVRDFYDTDKSPKVLEKFSKCCMMPNSKDYVAFKIGTIDGSYELKSSYVMLEINESEEVYNSVPCGFLGYPMRSYGDGVVPAPLKYNTKVQLQKKSRDQYFGFSDISGIDVDAFKYKGVSAYKGIETLTNGFHLDERLSGDIMTKNNMHLKVMGVEGYKFDTVSSKGMNFNKPAILFTESETEDSLFEEKKLRKFTVCFYGGFDGWDIYRRERTNTDEYRANKYAGKAYKQGNQNNLLDLPSNCNNSDYYAYLAGIRTFSNPEAVDINIFATPGINWSDHMMLTMDAISMIEDLEDGRGGDAIYVMASPFLDNASDVVSALNETGIDSSYAVTYWPWVKYFDYASQVYVNLPVTKDVVRNMAKIDRTSYPWFSPAGLDRGPVECVRATNFTRLAEEDELYGNMINPVKTFAADGVKIFGNKTVYSVDSPLNRVNVRRLMIRVKKLISTACRVLIFEPNDSTIASQFTSIVESILDNVKSNRGIYAYKLKVDNSPEAMDAHTLPAVISIKPTPTLEYIDLTFKITPTGASFED